MREHIATTEQERYFKHWCRDSRKKLICNSNPQLNSTPMGFSNWSKTQILIDHMKITSLFYHNSDHVDTYAAPHKSQLKSNPTGFSNWSKTQILVNHIKIASLCYHIQTIRIHSFICKSNKNGQDPKWIIKDNVYQYNSIWITLSWDR